MSVHGAYPMISGLKSLPWSLVPGPFQGVPQGEHNTRTAETVLVLCGEGEGYLLFCLGGTPILGWGTPGQDMGYPMARKRSNCPPGQGLGQDFGQDQ